MSEAPDDSPIVEKIGYLDIESTNFQADYGYIFSYAIKTRGEDTILGRIIRPSEIRRFVFDRKLMEEFVEDVKKFHRIVTYYGTRFDVPFLRSRCIKWGIEFPGYQDVYMSDCYYMVRNKLRLHNNRLESACNQFDIPCKEHKGIPDIWIYASAGHQPSLDHIWEHNKEDVIALEGLHIKMENFSKRSKVSI